MSVLLFFTSQSLIDMYVRSGCTLAWRRILSKKNWQESKLTTSMPNLLTDYSQLANLGFSPLHRAYLGISSTILEEALASTSRSAIDKTDATGRTTLSWVCARGDCYMAIRLLTCGADPNRPDISGLTPLHWLTYSHGSCCTSLLLAAKADVNHKTRSGDTAASMLACLCHSEVSRLSCLRILTTHGVDLGHANNFGRTLLMGAASYDRPTLVSYLLDHGVNINTKAKRGATALSLAVYNNCHLSLQILLRHPTLDYTGRYVWNYTLLHQAARYGDIETLEILQKATLGRLDVVATHMNFTAQHYAQRRRNNNDGWSRWAMRPSDKDPVAWYIAFEALLNSIDDARTGIDPLAIEEATVDDHAQLPEEVGEDAPELSLEQQY